MKEKLNELYNPKSLEDKDAARLANIAKTTIQQADQTIGQLNQLVKNIAILKECVVDSINLQAEMADLTSKYGNTQEQQSHILPGVSTTPTSFNMQDLKADNFRMESIKDDYTKQVDQKEIYLRATQEDVRLFLQQWKRLNNSVNSFDEFIYALNDSLNPNY